MIFPSEENQLPLVLRSSLPMGEKAVLLDISYNIYIINRKPFRLYYVYIIKGNEFRKEIKMKFRYKVAIIFVAVLTSIVGFNMIASSYYVYLK